LPIISPRASEYSRLNVLFTLEQRAKDFTYMIGDNYKNEQDNSSNNLNPIRFNRWNNSPRQKPFPCDGQGFSENQGGLDVFDNQ
jgi:hypothetical protein